MLTDGKLLLHVRRAEEEEEIEALEGVLLYCCGLAAGGMSHPALGGGEGDLTVGGETARERSSTRCEGQKSIRNAVKFWALPLRDRHERVDIQLRSARTN